jgi:CRP/FNR family transcriptional regulator
MRNESEVLSKSTPNMIATRSIKIEPHKIDVYKFLCSHPAFSKIAPSQIKELADKSRTTSTNSGQYIVTEGDEQSLYGYVVVSGTLAITKSSANGKELIVELLQSGDIFGLLLSLAADKLPSQLSAKCLEKSQLIWIPLDQFAKLVSANNSLLNAVVTHLLVSLQASYCLSRGLAHDKVNIRIATILSSLALKHTKYSHGEACYVINLTRQQLADLTGTTSETAIRVTRAMQRQGMIDIKHPGVIRIVNLPLLNRLAAE